MAKISRTRVTDTPSPTLVDNNDAEVEQAFEDYNDSLRKAANDDEMPARTQRPTRSAVSSGWGDEPEERTETVKAPRLVLKDNGLRVVKLLEAVPPVKYQRHFINSKNAYFTCLQDDCPLCDLTPPDGRNRLKASWTYVMNVVDMGDKENEVKTWTFGNEVSSQLQSISKQKDIVLNDENAYFEVKHVPVAGRKAPGTNVAFMRGRYLQEEHAITPLAEDAIESLNADRYGAEVVWVVSKSYLANIARDVVPGDFPAQTKRG